MNKLFQILIFLPIIFFGCSETTNEPKMNDNFYVKGEVVFGMKPSIELEQVLITIFSIGEIKQIDFNLYQSSDLFPAYSLDYIKSILSNYNFFDTTLTYYFYPAANNRWEFNFFTKDFKLEYLTEWENLRNQLNLYITPGITEFGLLKIDEGKETYWINKLRETDVFEWVDYNHVVSGH